MSQAIFLPSDLALMGTAAACILAAVLLITRFKLHPFLGLLAAAMALGLLRGLGGEGVASSIEKGFGSIMGGAGLVVALGLCLGAILQLSGAAATLAQATIGAVPDRFRPWGSLAAAMVIGLPLFFETGVVLIIPIIGAVAAGSGVASEKEARRRLGSMLSALAGLSILHALIPPHPGPMIAVRELHADIGRTMLLGLMVAIPTAIVAGPILARYTSRWVQPPSPIRIEPLAENRPSFGVSLLIVLLPVLLIAAGAAGGALPVGGGLSSALALVGSPAPALLIANLVALALLFGRPHSRVAPDLLWRSAMEPAGSILLSIGAGGALKQVLVDAGMASTFTRIAQTGAASPILIGWTMAALIRLATGSATVATITASGVAAGMLTHGGAGAEWLVLAIGAGSVFFSHVNDPGFWLVKGYLGLSTADTFKTWSVLETAISVIGLGLILVLSRVLG